MHALIGAAGGTEVPAKQKGSLQIFVAVSPTSRNACSKRPKSYSLDEVLEFSLDYRLHDFPVRSGDQNGEPSPDENEHDDHDQVDDWLLFVLLEDDSQNLG